MLCSVLLSEVTNAKEGQCRSIYEENKKIVLKPFRVSLLKLYSSLSNILFFQ